MGEGTSEARMNNDNAGAAPLGKPSPRLLVVSAPSGAGKTSLCARLLKDFPGLSLSVSSTTRAPRGRERDGVEYHFLSRERFQEMIDAGAFAEWAFVHGNYYGTSRAVIDAAFARGLSVLLDIDVQGAHQLKAAYPDRCTTIFVTAPDLATIEKRLRSRGTDSEETIRVRMRNAEEELTHAPRFDRVIVNDEFERAYHELSAFVRGLLDAGIFAGGKES
jgi:guanylate kinase